jgi:hypothetical protein
MEVAREVQSELAENSIGKIQILDIGHHERRVQRAGRIDGDCNLWCATSCYRYRLYMANCMSCLADEAI